LVHHRPVSLYCEPTPLLYNRATLSLALSGRSCRAPAGTPVFGGDSNSPVVGCICAVDSNGRETESCVPESKTALFAGRHRQTNVTAPRASPSNGRRLGALFSNHDARPREHKRATGGSTPASGPTRKRSPLRTKTTAHLANLEPWAHWGVGTNRDQRWVFDIFSGAAGNVGRLCPDEY